MIIALERFIPWLDTNNRPTQRTAEYIEEMTKRVNLNTPIVGTGSPEGVVTANPTQKYMDTAGTAGNISYIKQSGTGSTGWILE
ncbi:MAG: hypothetical protein ACYTBJ_24725 [Planctomycetota bacterium]|jgi:hypothetical protein